MPMYAWQRKIHDSTNRVNLLTAANQVGKSSALIRRAIANCTEEARWEKLWGKGVKPKQFWYFYPDGNTVEKEVTTKWIPEWLPRGPMQNDPVFGWKLDRKSGTYFSIKFNTGATIYFQFYTKSVTNIQAGTVYEVFVDEELPMDFYDEVMFRLTATGGIFTSGFTPTLNQVFWRQAMEGNKVLPRALKMCVSMYECLKYDDNTPSRIMTMEKIKEAESKCKNDTERQRRIFGKFITEEGRAYYGFEYDRNVCEPYKITGWNVYAGVDYGSGADNESQKRVKNHPAAIIFIAVNAKHTKAAVFKSWRGDNVKTTAGDVFNRYLELRGNMGVIQACYDPAAADFGTIASRNGVNFIKANKARDAGEDLLNTLFKHKMLDIFDDDPENLKLASELTHLMINTNRGLYKKDDDLTDAVRYCAMMIPWDFSEIKTEAIEQLNKVVAKKNWTEEELLEMQIKMRRGEQLPPLPDESIEGWGELEEEFDEWNERYG